jgi:hypothetical protein
MSAPVPAFVIWIKAPVPAPVLVTVRTALLPDELSIVHVVPATLNVVSAAKSVSHEGVAPAPPPPPMVVELVDFVTIR